MQIPTCEEWYEPARRTLVRYAAFAVFVIILCWLGAELATAHGVHDWIAAEGHRNAQGEWCCGEGDCELVEPVRITEKGYLLPAFKGETVPYAEAKVSKDGKYWRCHRPDGSRRCFFAPPPST